MKGTIYRIVSISHPEIQYVGSTGSTMAQRWYQHKRNFAVWKNGLLKGELSIYPYMLACGIDDFQILKIKDYDVVDKYHLSTYEQLYVNRIRCVNKNNPWGVSPRNCKWMTKEYHRIHYQNNKEIIDNKGKVYYENHKEVIDDYQKEYKQANREKIIGQQKTWYNENKANKVALKVMCECGNMVAIGSKKRHEKRKIHTDRV